MSFTKLRSPTTSSLLSSPLLSSPFCLLFSWGPRFGGTRGKEPACQCRRYETWVQSLGQEDPLEEGMRTHSSILAWRITMDRETGWLHFIGSQRVRQDWSDWALTHTLNILTFSPKQSKTFSTFSSGFCFFRAVLQLTVIKLFHCNKRDLDNALKNSFVFIIYSL